MIFLGVGKRTSGAQAPTPKEPPPKPQATERPKKSYVRNGGFESVKADKPVMWGLSSYPRTNVQELLSRWTVTTEKAHSGTRSLKIDFSGLDARKAQQANGRELLIYHHLHRKDVLALRGKRVILSMWAFYESLPTSPVGPYMPGPWFDVSAGVQGKTIGLVDFVMKRPFLAQFGYVTDAQVLGQWVRIEKKLSVPAEAKWLRLRGGLSAWDTRDPKRRANRTSLYLDDVRIELAGK